jgi:hypothetical protein
MRIASVKSNFTCPNCDALYHVIKIEAGPEFRQPRNNLPRLRRTIVRPRRQVCPEILPSAQAGSFWRARSAAARSALKIDKR